MKQVIIKNRLLIFFMFVIIIIIIQVIIVIIILVLQFFYAFCEIIRLKLYWFHQDLLTKDKSKIIIFNKILMNFFKEKYLKSIF